jgi:BMFP domain-containing protein YqiC
MTPEEEIARLEKEIAELEARLPKHSVPPAMLQELEELEDELAALEARRSGDTV